MILLVRHAAHVELGAVLSGRRRDVELSGEGLDQAAALGERLAALPIGAVYSSPRERAWRTAHAVAEPHGLKVTVLDDLDEVDFGDWSGRSFDSLAGDPDWRRWNEARASASTPGGETMGQAVERAVGAIEAMARDDAGETAVAVSHCDIIRGVIAHYLGLSLDNLLRFDVDPASASRLEVGDWGGRIISVNERLCR